jgi:hypothetical protein
MLTTQTAKSLRHEQVRSRKTNDFHQALRLSLMQGATNRAKSGAQRISEKTLIELAWYVQDKVRNTSTYT